MFVHHNVISSGNSDHSEDLRKEHIQKLPEKLYEKGDPAFVDERVPEKKKPKEEKTFLEDIFGE